MSNTKTKLEKWASKHADKLSHEAREELEAIKKEAAASVEDNEENEDNEKDQSVSAWAGRFKRRLWKVLKWAGIGALGAATVGGAVYVGKQALDATPVAIEVAAKREMNERIEMAQKVFMELQQSSNTLLLRLLDFLITLKDRASSPSGIGNMVVNLWDGVWTDAKAVVTDGDLSPDSTIAAMERTVESDPILKPKMDAIYAAYDDLKQKQIALEKLATDIKTFDDQDAMQFLVDYKTAFWQEMRGKSAELH